VAVSGRQRIVPASTGLLLGWTGIAALVNAASVATSRGVRPRSTATVTAESALLLAGACALTGIVASSRRGAVPVAATTGWALATIAATARPPATRIAAGGGLLAVGAALISRVKRDRPRH
jgi:hypothetical protein